MTWTKMGDSEPDEMEAAGLSPEAFTLYWSAMAYSNRIGTDGRISRTVALRKLYGSIEDPEAAVRVLVATGYWTETETGYEIAGFLDNQPSADEVKRQRELKNDRQKRYMAKVREGKNNPSTKATTNGDASNDASHVASNHAYPAPRRPAPKEGGVGRGATASGSPGGSPSPAHPSVKSTTNNPLTTDRGPSWSYEPEDGDDDDPRWRSTVAEVPFEIKVWSADDDEGEDRPGWVDIYTTLIDPPSGYLPNSVTEPVYKILKSEFASDVDVTESEYSFSIEVEASEADYWLDRVMDAVSSERVRSVVRKRLIPHGSPEWEARRSKAVRSLDGAGGTNDEWEFSIRTKPAMTQINGAPHVLIEGHSVIIVGPKSVPELAGDRSLGKSLTPSGKPSRGHRRTYRTLNGSRTDWHLSSRSQMEGSAYEPHRSGMCSKPWRFESC